MGDRDIIGPCDVSARPFIRQVARFMWRQHQSRLGVRPIVPVTKHCQLIYGALFEMLLCSGTDTDQKNHLYKDIYSVF